MPLAMSQSECETLLSEPHIGVISVERQNRAPMCVPMWYTYAPGGDVCIWTGRTSAKMRLMERYGRFSLCVQTGQPPYKFVSVEGRVSSANVIDYERHLRPLVYRYLGERDGKKYLVEYGGPSAVANDLWVRMTPEAWYSEDYSKS
ncbi:MAG: pyridoxamine 5'-phosphate oxidase family protein [Gammaproteobacteria bacterium]|nr:pyridoxamine 5'-phosphate oxidase family protein [Gammaproteobacteria bacterium]